ncbi:MAG TPA: Rieske 2Fe-2S domain-containing protein, partial [Actinomycetota bacterium]|nr:Rieske 2Fe-2S domain-containing protein [Actinomycetota bacterium]
VLTDVPIGTWTSALILDVFPGKASRRAADNLIGAGLLATVPTIITGLSELADVTRKEDRRLGAAHAIGNAAATTLYAMSWLARRRGRRSRGVILSLLGAAVVSGGAFLGGDLAYRRGVGVSQMAFDEPPHEWSDAYALDGLDDRIPTKVQVGGTDVLLVRRGAQISAIADRCTHRGGPLHEGTLEDDCIRCPWHDSVFRLDDGQVDRGPATAPAPVYDVRVRNGRIQLRARS